MPTVRRVGFPAEFLGARAWCIRVAFLFRTMKR